MTLSWALPDEKNDYADNVLQLIRTSAAVVPTVWPYEVTNVLLVAERRGRITASECWRFLDFLKLLPIDIDGRTMMGPRLEDLFGVGRNQRLSGYDAAFVELAEHHHLPLATLDKDMQRAAGELGVERLDAR